MEVRAGDRNSAANVAPSPKHPLKILPIMHCALKTLLMASAGCLALLSPLRFARGAEGAPVAVQFNRDIRPILADKCFACHGPDANQRQADLRFDQQQSALSDRDGVRAIVPGKLDESELFRRITADDEGERMPPADFGKALSAREIDLLKQWIEQGAPWQEHWSRILPRRPRAPAVSGALQSDHPIDAFILARLKREGLEPSRQADRRTLARRLSFDLTGLPPAPQEVERFVGDTSPQAYEAYVDRLLASEHYGERMAVFWLDLVRYADTNGIHGDNHREHWLYRDYVIAAFNDNKPFNVFTIEQLAGDLLPESTRDQRIASGYNRLNMTTREGGAQAKEYRAKYAADRVRNASSVWLGATLGCAECHDHKFDPYTTKEFYQFAAFFADIQETAVGVQQPTMLPTAEQAEQIAALDGRIGNLQKILDTPTPELAAAQDQWERDLKEREVQWVELRPVTVSSEGGAVLTVQEDAAIVASGGSEGNDTYNLQATVELESVTAIRIDVLPDDSLPSNGPGRAGNGNFVLSEIELLADGKPIALASATATHSQKDWPVTAAIDGNLKTGWAILPEVGKANHAVLEIGEDGAVKKGAAITLRLRQHYGGSHQLGKFRVSVTSAARPVHAEGAGMPENVTAILAATADERTEEHQKELAAYYRSIAPQLAETRNEIASLKKQKQAVEDAAPKLLVSTAGPPMETRVLPRGNWLDDSGEVVLPETPSSLGGLKTEKERATRLELAEWIVDPNNPATARVFVNRLWKLCFGRGIVKSLDDFGSQGEWPTHPELLDWLAVEFIDSGWDVKHMVKLIVTSDAYQQTSLASDELRAIDPFNRLLARQGRFRLDAEMVRDNALAVSGLLVREIGGPSVKPYQPPGYWSHLNFPKREYEADDGAKQYRRGLYTYWCRTFLHPSMLAFDAPSREECAVERSRSNTPLAALVLLNDPSYVEAARALAERTIREGGGNASTRIAFIFRQVLARAAQPAEQALLTALVERHLMQFQQDPDAASKVIQVGQSPAPGDLDAAELASWTSAARVVLNLHETIVRN